MVLEFSRGKVRTMQTRRFILVVLAASLAAVFAFNFWSRSSVSAEYNPVINPADFVAEVTNPYFTLKPGRKFVFNNNAGTERVEITVTKETKKIMGVTTVVVRATEWKNGVLKEDTRDWYAQDRTGNVWYFGEAVDNYADGKISNHAGSWEAGVDNAKPGIIMMAKPKVGESYRQEYYKGKAEDMGTIVAVDKNVTTPAGSFDGCLQIRDWSTIETASEYKYYCPKVGFLVQEESTMPMGGKTVLVAVSDE
jgi:hypothetical protein